MSSTLDKAVHARGLEHSCCQIRVAPEEIAQMGALQVWRHSLTDQAKAVRQYRNALALGGTQGLPEIYHTAGARLVFDAETMGELVALVEKRLMDLRVGR